MNYNNRFKAPFIISFIANILLAATLIVVISHYPFDSKTTTSTVTPAAIVTYTDIVSATSAVVEEVSETDVSPADVSETDITSEVTEATTSMRTRADEPAKTTKAPKKTTAKKTKATAAPTQPPVGSDNDGEWLNDWI